MPKKEDSLFPELHKARYGEHRRQRNLILPKLLNKESLNQQLRGADYRKAHDLFIKWADLEARGKLGQKSETNLRGEFLTELFGQALGYTLFSANVDQWNLEAEYPINGGAADAAIGLFDSQTKKQIYAVIELKGPKTNLDKDRSGGRTAVQQCWDYLNALPQCPWGIVCNYVSFRLYHRNQTPRVYELFTLQDLKEEDEFRKFYYLFEKSGLLPATVGQRPRADVLLETTNVRQRQVGDKLYEDYHTNRIGLIDHLRGKPWHRSLDAALDISQKLLDRIIFIAFCQCRELLPEKSIQKAWGQVPPFYRVTNPRWRNFLDLFRSIDRGNKDCGISPFNGGLFKEDPEVDDLDLEDRWTEFFNNIGDYDFRDEINVDVLGHLFERSIHDVEKIRLGGFFEEKAEEETGPKMAKSAERKRFGIYYTPPEFTTFITRQTVGKVIEERFDETAKKLGVDPDGLNGSKPDPKSGEYWKECFTTLTRIKVVDPACGSGAFLIQAYEILEEKYQDVVDNLAFYDEKEGETLREKIPYLILHENLFGVDLSPQAVEITQLALWLRSAQRDKTLADLSHNIVCGNSLVTDTEVHPKAMDWQKTFPEVFNREPSGFDCVIGNPPWERMKFQSREFFAISAPDIIETVNPAQSRKLIAELETKNPDLYAHYIKEKESADSLLTYIRNSGRYPLTGKGDINTYAVFAELAHSIVSPQGRVGLLIPSGIATDHTTKDFFGSLVGSDSLIGLYDFENKAPIFPDVHRSYKFCVFLFGGLSKKYKAADFFFFAQQIEDLEDKKRHIALSPKDFGLLNPNTRTCPVFRFQKDAEITKAVCSRVPVLIDHNRKEGGNPWEVRFVRMFDQSNDAALFHDAKQLKAKDFKRVGCRWVKGKVSFLPLHEAKMIQMYDHRAASIFVKEENWMRQGQTDETPLIHHQNPEFCVEPRWWVEQKEIKAVMGDHPPSSFIAFKDVTSATNQRTMIAAFLPYVGVVHTAPLILTGETISKRLECCLLANLNSYVLDYVARQKVGGIHLTFFIVEQLPIFPPDSYTAKCPWDTKQTLEKWISERVLKLTCTSNDMIPLAEAAGFDRSVHKWKPAERADLQAELDAAFFHLYGINKEEMRYILHSFTGITKEGEKEFGLGGPFDRIVEHYDRLAGK